MNLAPIDTACFEKFLELFSEAYPNQIHIIQLDNGRAHLGLDLSIPDISFYYFNFLLNCFIKASISFVFIALLLRLPVYCPPWEMSSISGVFLDWEI